MLFGRESPRKLIFFVEKHPFFTPFFDSFSAFLHKNTASAFANLSLPAKNKRRMNIYTLFFNFLHKFADFGERLVKRRHTRRVRDTDVIDTKLTERTTRDDGHFFALQEFFTESLRRQTARFYGREGIESPSRLKTMHAYLF